MLRKVSGSLSPSKKSLRKSKSPKNLRLSQEGIAFGEPVDGFKTIPEIPSISVDPSNIAAFSMPQELVEFVPDENAAVTRFKNGEKERKLYCNTELTQEEQQNLKLLRQEAQSENVAFFPSVASCGLRYITRARGCAKTALEEMVGTQQWRQSYFAAGPITDASIAEDMKLGMVYWGGRDRHLRPSLVIRVARIPEAFKKDRGPERLVRLLVFCLEYMLHFLVYPGKVETGVIILDLRGVSMSQIPISPLKEVVKVLSAHYIYRVPKFYLCNVPWMLRKMSGVGTKFLTERQLQKLCFVNTADEILVDFAPHQLEEDLGGVHANVTVFFPFPLQAGPFDAGSTLAVNRTAIPNVHLAFRAGGLRGHAWDPALDREDNIAVECTEFAEDIFKQCGIAIPRGCPRRTAEEAKVARTAEEAKVLDAVVESAAVSPENTVKDTLESESTVINESSDVPTLPSSACESKQAPTTGTETSPQPAKEVVQQAGIISTPCEIVEEAEVRPGGFFTCIPQCAMPCR